MRTLCETLLDLVFPPRCAGCRERGALLCAACRAACLPVPASANAAAHQALGSPYLRSSAGVYLFDGPLRQAVHGLKYRRRRRVARPLGELLAAHLAGTGVRFDAVVPVPLHRDRLRERGFNQAALLAAVLSERLGVPLQADGLQRVRSTGQQAGLGREARLENVAGAFGWVAASPPPARVLLLDDVLTTGATIAAAAQALCEAGAVSVDALALARAIGGPRSTV
jgi:ComF family protein